MKCLLMLVLFALCAAAQQPSSAETLLQSGIKKETVDGNLAGAIEDYRKAVSAARSDRPLAARALFHLAQCYRKQGDAQAKATLERIVREFSDQPFAAQARAQLAALAGPSNAGGMRLQKLVSEKDYACSSVSFDGRLLGCAVDWINEAAVYEIATGKMRVLTSLRKESPANRYINTFAISPDGKTMALHIYRAGGVFSEIALVPTDGAGILKTVYKHPKDGWLDVVTWTPDSKEVLFTLVGERGVRTAPLMVLNAASGATRTLREIQWSLQWSFTSFSPDGKWLAVNVPGAEPRSFQVEIWDAAGRTVSQVDGAAGNSFAGWSPDGKFVILTSSHEDHTELLKYPVSEGKVTGPPQTVRTSVEGFKRVQGIDSKGTLYFTGGNIDSRIFSVPFDPVTGTLVGAEKQHSSSSIGRQGFGSWSPDGTKFASWSFGEMESQSVSKARVIVRSMPAGPESIATPETSFHAYRVPAWDQAGSHLLMLTPAGEGSVRFSRLDPLSGKVTPASVPLPLTNINSTPDWSPDGQTLYLRKQDGDLYSIDARTGAEKLIYKNPPDQTGARSTTVSPDGKRLAFFGATRIMKSGGEWTGTAHWWIHVLDLATGAVKDIETPHGFAFGASTLAWSPDGRFLVCAAGSGKLPSLWVVPSDGSAPPKALSKPLGGHVMHLAFAPGGRTLTYSLIIRSQDIWSMSNFLHEAR